MSRQLDTGLKSLVQKALNNLAPGTTFIQRPDGSLAFDGPEPSWLQELFPTYDLFPFASEGPAVRHPRFVHIPPEVKEHYESEVHIYIQDTAKLNSELHRRERHVKNEVDRLRQVIDNVRPVLVVWYLTEMWTSIMRETTERAMPERIWDALTNDVSVKESGANIDEDQSGLVHYQLPCVLIAFQARDLISHSSIDSVAHYLALEDALNSKLNPKPRDEPSNAEKFGILCAGWNDHRFVDMVEHWKFHETEKC